MAKKDVVLETYHEIVGRYEPAIKFWLAQCNSGQSLFALTQNPNVAIEPKMTALLILLAPDLTRLPVATEIPGKPASYLGVNLIEFERLSEELVCFALDLMQKLWKEVLSENTWPRRETIYERYAEYCIQVLAGDWPDKVKTKALEVVPVLNTGGVSAYYLLRAFTCKSVENQWLMKMWELVRQQVEAASPHQFSLLLSAKVEFFNGICNWHSLTAGTMGIIETELVVFLWQTRDSDYRVKLSSEAISAFLARYKQSEIQDGLVEMLANAGYLPYELPYLHASDIQELIGPPHSKHTQNLALLARQKQDYEDRLQEELRARLSKRQKMLDDLK